MKFTGKERNYLRDNVDKSYLEHKGWPFTIPTVPDHYSIDSTIIHEAIGNLKDMNRFHRTLRNLDNNNNNRI